MAHPLTSAESLADELFDICVFITMSAKLCVKEPHLYGPFRLLDVLQRVINVRQRLVDKPDAFLERVGELVEEKKWSVQWDSNEFLGFLDHLEEIFTEEVKSR